MVRSAQSPTLVVQIDETFDYLLGQWEEVPEVAAMWHHEFDGVAREIYQHEWTIPHDRFRNAQDWAQQGLLTPPQQARYAQLLDLIERMKPIRDRMFAEG